VNAVPAWVALPVAVLLVLGSALALLGAWGLLRMPSFYQRVHAPTLATTGGAASILLASMLFFSAREGHAVLHELLLATFLFIATPVGLLMLVRAALFRDRQEGNPGVPPMEVQSPAGEAPRDQA
jgi:multicomponent K+:H+ antiporter subunit G